MFGKQVEREVKTLLASSEDTSDEKFTHAQIAELPEVVQRYFKCSLREGQSYIKYVRLRHGGTFRQNQGQGWTPIIGEEYFTTENPGFVWHGKIKPFPILWITGRDRYFEGKGNMLIKLWSTFTLADAKGKEMDQSALVRWLIETPLFPTALLPSKRLQWEKTDSDSAKATLEDGAQKVTATFYFNEKGEITKATADRYMTANSKEKWTVYYRNWKKTDNIGIPQEIEATWSLTSGEFSYAKFKITDIEYNNPTKYE